MRLLHLGALAALLVASLVLAGCSGGDGTTPPAPEGATGSLAGHVVHADDVNIGISSATISVRGVDGTEVASGTANSAGSFSLTKVPVGQWNVVVETLNEANYGSQTVPGILISKGRTTTLTITVLRAIDASPTAINLSPTQATVDLLGQVDFNGSVVAPTGLLTATPTFLVSSSIGTIDRNGNFTATAAGRGQVIAICGDARATAEIEVTNPRAPEVTTYLVAPLKLKASGGTVTITVAANDGDGIRSVEAHIYSPGGEDVKVLPLDPRTTDTYRLTYTVAANSNQPDALGNQAAQRYSVQVIVTDQTGVTTATGFVDVTVAGLDAPPPPQ